MKLKSFEDLFLHELQDLYSAEQQITEALPQMMKAATSSELKQAFETHLRQTEGQIERLDRIFNMMDASSKGEKCKGMEGLIKEGQSLIKEGGQGEVVDAALIGAAQRVEHYEIAGYGTARTYAQQLGLNQAVQLLEQTLQEESQTDELLTNLAQRSINQRAQEMGG